MPRKVVEWVGKNDDSRPPPRVLLRIFERENGICHISGRKIAPGEKWQADHKIAIINGGKNCESNLFPALVGPHKEKTKADVAEKSAVAARAKSHIGVRRDKQEIKGDPHALKSRHRPAHEGRTSLPPRPMFESLGDVAARVLAKITPRKDAAE
jgi:5-methylcytosine-specific restriction enzyme A